MIDLTVIGNIGRDASINENNGRKAINFAVAHNSKYKDADGTEINKTTWVNCTIWRGQGESVKIKDYLLSGTLVACKGEPSIRTYKDKEGHTVAALDLTVYKVELLSSFKKDGE